MIDKSLCRVAAKQQAADSTTKLSLKRATCISDKARGWRMLQEFEAPLPSQHEAATAKVQTEGAINILFSIGACLLPWLR